MHYLKVREVKKVCKTFFEYLSFGCVTMDLQFVFCSRTNASALYYKTTLFTTSLCITWKASTASVMSRMNVKVVSQRMSLQRVLGFFCRWTCLSLSMSNILMDAAIKIEIKLLVLPFPFLA